MNIKGYYLDGKSSKRHEANLELNSHNGIKLYLHSAGAQHIGQELIMFNLDAIKIESRLANTAREITLAEEQLFISYDNDGIDALANRLSPTLKQRDWLHKLESNISAILLATFIMVAMVYAALIYGVPKSAHWLADNLPNVVEAQFSDSLALLDQSVLQESQLSPAHQKDLKILMAPYYQAFNQLNIRIEFRSGFGANAFALPDGTIVFTDDFIKLAKSDDEILAVLYHEIGHLANKHMLRRAIQASLMGSFILMVTGDLDTLDIITGLPSLLLDLSYSRDFEIEADQFALEQMFQADINIDHFGVIMRRLADANSGHSEVETEKGLFSKVQGYLSTHPITEDRVQRVLDFKEAHGIID